MGPIGMPELIMMFIIIGMILVPIAAVIWLVFFLVTRDEKTNRPPDS